MCKCIENVNRELVDCYQGKFKNKNIDTLGVDTLLSFNGEPEKTYSNITINIIGQKKKHSIILAHTYCPFCGEPYESKIDS